MGEKYNPEKEDSYIKYMDMNGLYASAMSMFPLPYGGFQWLSDTEIQQFDITTCEEDSNIGYILEVDVSLHPQYHVKFKDFPLFPEKERVAGGRTYKLLATLKEKKFYVVHYIYLQFALRHGYKLEKIHRIIKFQQCKWLGQYVDHNIELRKKARNNFESDYFKLLNNSTFGFTIMNIRRRQIIKLATSEKVLDKYLRKSNFKSTTVFDENLVAIHMYKQKIKLNQPLYVGFSILDISKFLIGKFLYDDTPVVFNDAKFIKVLYSDTDSFFLLINGIRDIVPNLLRHKAKFDLSGYPEDHPLYSCENKKVLGKMSDECPGTEVTHFVGLRSKMYCFKTVTDECKKRLKGIRSNILKNNITFEDYYRVLQECTVTFAKQMLIRSFKHQLFTVQQKKKALDGGDQKRIILEDGINTLPYGYSSYESS